jgi:dienelactone hydrolase
MEDQSYKFDKKKSGIFFFKSSSPFEFYHILNNIDLEPKEEIFGSLIFPENAKFPCPLVIPIHGSYGLRGNHHDHIVNLLEAGIAVFRIHSFESRGIISIVENQTEVTLATMITDAFRGLSLMSQHPDIDPNRIGIMGWSLGGSTSFYSAWKPIIKSLTTGNEKFSAHLPLYPGTHIKPDVNEWSDAPMHILCGNDDDYTPTILVKNILEYMKPNKSNVELTVYPNAHHSFDAIEPIEFIPYAIKLTEKFAIIDKEGHLTFTDSNNNVINCDDKEGRIQLIKQTPDILGAHAGGNWDARRQSHKDVISFFKKEFLSS